MMQLFRHFLFVIAGSFLIFGLSSSALADLVLPDRPTGYVNDYAAILSQDTKTRLESKLGSIETSIGHEIAVVTIPSLQETTIEDFAEKLFQKWGIGKERSDNGVLFLIAPNERRMRIEVGYGLEGALTDSLSKRILDQIVRPSFTVEDYNQGVIDGAEAIIAAIQDEPIAFPEELAGSTTGSNEWGGLVWFVFWLLFVVFSTVGGSKRWWPGGLVLGGLMFLVTLFAAWTFVTSVAVVVLATLLGFLFDYLLSKHGIYNKGGKGRGGRGGGIFFGGGSGGGFGGFSGGSSGGGGASSSW